MKIRNVIILVLLFLLVLFTACSNTHKTDTVATPKPIQATPVTSIAPQLISQAWPYLANLVNIAPQQQVMALGLARLEDEPFYVEITNTDDVVLVEFWSETCEYCELMLERMIDVSRKTGVKVVRVNVDENPKLADDYGLVALPTVYLFKEGEHRDGILGAAPLELYVQYVEKYRQ